MIYNPYFEQQGIDAVVMPMGVKAEDYPQVLASLRKLTNLRGALITMPHKVTTVGPGRRSHADGEDRRSVQRHPAACRRQPAGRHVRRCRLRPRRAAQGTALEGASALVVGCGGVGSAIAASLAAAGVAKIGLFDANAGGRRRPRRSPAPALSGARDVDTGSNDPAGYALVVNATPMGMNDGDPLPIDVNRIAPSTIVGEVVMKQEMTRFPARRAARGCRFQVGTDMLFEQIPAYLEFFGFPTTTPENLRAVAKIRY